MQRNIEVETTLVAKFVVMAPLLDERARRLWAAAESVAIGYGGDALVSAATGLARETIRHGRRGATGRRHDARPHQTGLEADPRSHVAWTRSDTLVVCGAGTIARARVDLSLENRRVIIASSRF